LENLCVLEFLFILGFLLGRRPAQSHRVIELDGQSSRQGEEKPQSCRGMITCKEMAGSYRAGENASKEPESPIDKGAGGR